MILLNFTVFFLFAIGVLLLFKIPFGSFLCFCGALYLLLFARKEKKRCDDDDRAVKAAALARDRALLAATKEQAYLAFLSSIPRAEITLSDRKIPRPGRYEGVECTNITTRSNISALSNFTVIDTETTGLNASNCKIIEVAAIRYRNFIPVACFQTLLNPGAPIPDDASRINHITDDMVANAPKFSAIVDSLSSFIGSDNLVGHNLSFDLKFLRHSGLEYSGKRKFYDTLQLSRRVLEKYVDVDDYKLTTLSKHYSIRPESVAHRALSDCYATGVLFIHMVLEKAGTIPIDRDRFNAMHFGYGCAGAILERRLYGDR